MKQNPMIYKPYKSETPTARRFMQSESEFRAELPFSIFDHLAYIGKLEHETWHVQPHYHDHYELCYVEEGRGWFAVGEYFYEVGRGDLFLTKPGEVHHGAASGDSNYRLYYFGFHLTQLLSLQHQFLNLGDNRVAIDSEGKIRSLCDSILEEIRSGIEYSREMVQGLMMQTLVCVLRVYEQARRTECRVPLTLPAAIRELLYRLSETDTIPEMEKLAAGLNISRSHMDREFKRYMGISVGRYIRLLWMERAKVLLRNNQLSVTEIAEKLGFESIHAFSLFSDGTKCILPGNSAASLKR